MEKNIESLKERVAKLKEKSRNITGKLGAKAATSAGVDTQVMASAGHAPAPAMLRDKSREEELLGRISLVEQEKALLGARIEGLLNEKKHLEQTVSEISRANERLKNRAAELEKSKCRAEEELENASRVLKKYDLTAWNKYSVDLVSQFINEANRYFRTTQGMIREAIGMCIGDSGANETLKKKIAVVEEKFKEVIDVFLDAKTKYTFESVKLERINLKSVVEAVLHKNSGKFPQAVSIETKFQDPEKVLPLDPALFTEMLSELLANASESIFQKGSITIETKTMGRKTIVEVADTGEGIPPHLVEKIFCPFMTTKQDHTGLGLARVYWIVQLHNAKIDFESKVNKGTKFTIIFTEEE
ncbi:MAG: hypothetical protein A2297_05275 [Elusimicrobia bacterium RIFOXYB2_FULL_48_7]|nr:MAG: hypothetical protein A2297_05275 [Elusimicrobia bacterium RIFOXYB2_FULL_48_7]